MFEPPKVKRFAPCSNQLVSTQYVSMVGLLDSWVGWVVGWLGSEVLYGGGWMKMK